jgi:histidine triad (HIT) family protein
MRECVFCDIVGGRRDAYVLYEDDSHMAFLDRYPVVPGHALIIPKAHHSTILEMGPERAGSLFSLVPLLAPAILHATGTAAFNVGQNNGDAAKQVVPHVHVHIIPRRPNDRINWNARAIADAERFDGMVRSVREYLAR